MSTCYPLGRTDVCPRYGLLPRCTPLQVDRAQASNASAFCGDRLATRNPCWRHNGTVACLPLFFVLGEMKCGTTSLYSALLAHPDVVSPHRKEPRFLDQPVFQRKSTAWYASNFGPLASRVATPRWSQAVTLDASPSYFSGRTVAPAWISRWLPAAKLLVILRHPVERARSHHGMAIDWMRGHSVSGRRRVGRCRALAQLGAAGGAAGWAAERAEDADVDADAEALSAVLMPSADVRAAVQRLLPLVMSFEHVARFGVAKTLATSCNVSTRNWTLAGVVGGGAPSLSRAEQACFVSRSTRTVGREVVSIVGRMTRVPTPGGIAESVVTRALATLHSCGGGMLSPTEIVSKSVYAPDLARWQREAGSHRVHVLTLDELRARPNETMDAAFRFLGVRHVSNLSVDGKRACVTGMAGVLPDPIKDDTVIGRPPSETLTDLSDCGGGRQPSVGRESKTADVFLNEVYKRHNRALYKIIGRDLGW